MFLLWVGGGNPEQEGCVFINALLLFEDIVVDCSVLCACVRACVRVCVCEISLCELCLMLSNNPTPQWLQRKSRCSERLK